MYLAKEDYEELTRFQLVIMRVLKRAVMSEEEELRERNFSKLILENRENPNVSQKSIITELREMLIKLKIGGSPRVRKNGLLELRSQHYGSTYGRTVEELEQNLIKKIRFEKSHQGTKKKNPPAVVITLAEFFEKTYIPYKKDRLQPNSLDAVKYDFGRSWK